MAVWPSEEDLLLGASVPLPATPVQQRYEGRLSRARKVNSERRSVTRLTPAAVEKEEGGEEDVKAEVEEVAEMAMVEEEKVEKAAAESSEQTAEAAVVPPPPPPPPAAATAIPRRPSTDADEQAACSSGAANLYLHTSHYVSRHSTISHDISRYLPMSRRRAARRRPTLAPSLPPSRACKTRRSRRAGRPAPRSREAAVRSEVRKRSGRAVARGPHEVDTST